MNACYASCQYFWMKRTTNNQMTNVLSHKGCVVRGFCLEVHNGCYFDYRCIHLKWPLIISNIHARMNSILETPQIKLLVDILHISLVKSMDMYFFINHRLFVSNILFTYGRISICLFQVFYKQGLFTKHFMCKEYSSIHLK